MQWTAQEISFLKDSYANPDISCEEISRRLNRTNRSIMVKASRLGLIKEQSRFLRNKIDIEKLLDDRRNLTNNELSLKYNIQESTLDSWVQYLNLPRKSNIKNHLDEDFSLNDKQQQMLNGHLLGDGTITKKYKDERNCLFVLKYKDREEYLNYFINEMKPLFEKVLYEYKKDDSIMCKTNSICHPIFTQLENKWYLRNKEGDYIYTKYGKQNIRKKVIPEDFRLTLQMVYCWYIDDGSLYLSTEKNCLQFATHSFSIGECEFLISELKRLGLFGFSIVPNSKKKNKPIIYLTNKKSIGNFMDFIYEYNESKCFSYKFSKEI